MPSVLRCAQCVTGLLDPRDRFCNGCGAAVNMRCGRCHTTIAYAALFCPGCGADMGETAQAERRQLTIMYCDLVRSTALSLRLDPEEMRAVTMQFQQVCTRIIKAAGGMVNRQIGDAIQAYFGFPVASEAAAETAVRAGLQIAAAVAQCENPLGERMSVRVGLDTGLVVMGDVVGEGSAREYQAIGDAANLAAHLQGFAKPGMVVISEATRRLAAARFELRALGPRLPKGYSEPVAIWAVLAEAPARRRFVPDPALGPGALIGREAASEVLLARRYEAWSGFGQVVLISGDAGIGKSHLAAWLAAQPVDQPHLKLYYQCSHHHQGSALHPVITQIRQAAGFLPDDSPAQQLDKLEARIAWGQGDVQAAAPLFAALLSIPTQGRYPGIAISTDQQRRQTLDALHAHLAALARQQPLLIVLEDLQWADATTLELLAEALPRLARLPVLLMATHRSDFTPGWAAAPHITTLPLSRLAGDEALAMVQALAGAEGLPHEAMSALVARADGVPLYLAELTRTALLSLAPSVGAGPNDSLGLHSAASSHGSSALAPVIPETLRDALVERLDRLPSVKEVAQIAAAIGRNFSYSLLQAVSARDTAVLDDALARLAEAKVLMPLDSAQPGEHRFQHALVQEAAYETMLKSRRQPIHQRIADTLAQAFPERAAQEPEVVAHHYQAAQCAPEALHWWRRAGDWAVSHSAYSEAASHFSAALALAQAQPPGPEQRLLELGLLLALGQVLIASRGYAAPEATAAYKRARALVGQIEDVSQRYSVYYGLWAGGHIRSDLATMREMSEAFLHDVRERPGTPEDGIAQRLAGTTAAFVGDFSAARDHLSRVLTHYDPARDGPLAYRFGQDIGVSAGSYLALALWALGDLDAAATTSDTALKHAQASGHAPTLAYAHAYRCMLEALRQRPLDAVPHGDALVALSRENGMHWWVSQGLFFRGWAIWHAGRTAEGEADMRRGRELCREHGLLAPPTLFELLTAQTEALSGALPEALHRLDQLLLRITRTSEYAFAARVHADRAALLLRLHPNDSASAEAALVDSLAMAKRQGAHAFELQAALARFRLRHPHQLDLAVQQDLAQACAHFALLPNHPDLPELAQARSLISSSLA